MKNDMHLTKPRFNRLPEHRVDVDCAVRKVLRRETPDRFVYAPNYWQWFSHRMRHAALPKELERCRTQLDMIRHLEQDVFSRNIYSDQMEYWFGGFVTPVRDTVAVSTHRRELPNGDRLTVVNYETPKGVLSEELLYVHEHSTLVQKKYLIDSKSPRQELDAFRELVRGTKYVFDPGKYRQFLQTLRPDEVVAVGDVVSPLKLLHLAANPTETIFLLLDHPELFDEIMRVHQENQLGVIDGMLSGGVEVVMAMDNLDAAFHTKKYIDRYSADFYRKASSLCREHGAKLFIHACGQQKAIIETVAALDVDGLEGVSFPPLGDIELLDAMKKTAPNLLITGGISAHQTTNITSAHEADEYLKTLFDQMRPYVHRFMLSASCNISVETSWDCIRWIGDAYRKHLYEI